MTDTVTGTSRGTAPRRRRLLVAVTVAVVVLVAVAGAGLWSWTRVSVALSAGPLEGTHFEEVASRLSPGDAGLLWGSLLLHNGTGRDVVLEEAVLAGNPDGITPLVEPYVWDTDRVELLQTGAVSAYQLPLPADWRIPPKHPVKGFVIRPHAEDDSVEVLFELPVPRRAVTLTGITVGYRIGDEEYRNTYDLTLKVCPPGDTELCE